MGWNSWNSYGTTVTEAEVLANARVLRERLLPLGWDTVVVDIAWYDPIARAHGYNDNAPLELDDHGRLMPVVARFPSAEGGAGFGPLAAELHDMGLKFGIHVMRGIPRRAVDLDLPILGTRWTAREIADHDHVCPWNPDNFGLDHDHPGAQAYYDAQIAQYARWGVDYLKVDDMLAPYHEQEIEAFARAVRRSGRAMTLSLSPGTRLSTRHIPHLRANAHLWRISDDVWDLWSDIESQFARLARWVAFQQPGGWADADMLPLGRIGLRAERGEPRISRLSVDEQKTMLTLWAMARSPLMMGGDLPTSDDSTLGRLANPMLRELLMQSTGNGEVLREPLDDGELIVWAARSAAEPRHYAALFSTATRTVEVEVAITSITGMTADHEWQLTDAWDASPPPMIAGEAICVTIPPHGVRWLALDPECKQH